MIRPDLAEIMKGATARAHSKGPRTLTAMSRSHSSLPMSKNGFFTMLAKIAALLTRMSTAPNSDRARSAIASTEARSETSVLMKMACPPLLLMLETVFSPSSTSAMTTWAPAAANAALKAAPIPRAPPVTIATLPDNLLMAFSLSISLASREPIARYRSEAALCARRR